MTLNTVLRDLETLLRRAIGETVIVEVVGAGGLWKTRLDQGKFENAVLNFALNARDAIPHGGRLTIETANMRLDAEYAEQHSEVTPGQYVMVAVTEIGAGAGEQIATPGRPAGATGHVLLVEDDSAILRYAERTFMLLGYSVDTALTGDAAAGLLRSRLYEILLTDVVLPGHLNGTRRAELACKLAPGIKVLFMSGYTENAIVHNGQLDPGVELISKPFTRDQLSRRLQVLTQGMRSAPKIEPSQDRVLPERRRDGILTNGCEVARSAHLDAARTSAASPARRVALCRICTRVAR